ncbi:lipid II flippase MurJ [Natronomonas marina]|uniref:lipid II flippase MurJ n=1 Tax=Natronomonas marina TaxID=2961939 RepID=UPI0020C9815F|nr:polysaccharide biosynthesis C-terminal domain-containing protein [Natronomonas marina]
MDLSISASKLTISRIFSIIIGFAGITIFSQKLGASGIGKFFLFQATVAVSGIISDLGVQTAAEKKISGKEDKREFLTASVLLKISTLIIASFIIFTLKAPINHFLNLSEIYLLIVGIWLSELYKTGIKILNAELRVGETAVLRLWRQVCWVLGSIIYLLFINISSDGLILAFLLSYLTSIFWIGAKISITPGYPTKFHFKSLFDYAAYSYLAFNLSGEIYNWADTILIGIFLTSAQVGAYEIAWRISGLLPVISEAIGTTIFAYISKEYSDNNLETIKETASNSLIPSILLPVPAFFGVIYLSDEILTIFFGKEFVMASIPLIILSSEKIFRSVHVIYGHLLSATNEQRIAGRISILSSALNLIMNIILINYIGIIGAAVATAVSAIINTTLHIYYSNRHISLSFPVRDILWVILSSMIMGILVATVGSISDIDTGVKLVLIIMFGVLVYTTLILSRESIRSGAISTVKRLKQT